MMGIVEALKKYLVANFTEILNFDFQRFKNFTDDKLFKKIININNFSINILNVNKLKLNVTTHFI